MARRRVYIFDIDGTLISTGGAGSDAMRSAFETVWRLPDSFTGVEFSGRTDRAIFKDALMNAGLHGDAFEADLRRFKRAYFSHLPESLRTHEGLVLPGVVALLRELSQDDGSVLALGTGNFRGGAAMKLRHYGIDRYFESRRGGFGDDTEDRESLIGRAIRSAKRGAGRNAEVLVIGDTVHDINAAKANNVIAVGVATGTTSEEALSDAGADIVLATLESAAKLLR